jgi:hypothetical protein
MDAETRRETARAGGLAAARSKKRPHRFTPEEAAKAARKSHKTSPGSRNPKGRKPEKKRGFDWVWDEDKDEWILVPRKKKGS